MLAGIKDILIISTSSDTPIFKALLGDGKNGVVEFDENGNDILIEEKPKKLKSHFAVVGFYFYLKRILKFAIEAMLSARGELEI